MRRREPGSVPNGGYGAVWDYVKGALVKKGDKKRLLSLDQCYSRICKSRLKKLQRHRLMRDQRRYDEYISSRRAWLSPEIEAAHRSYSTVQIFRGAFPVFSSKNIRCKSREPRLVAAKHERLSDGKEFWTNRDSYDNSLEDWVDQRIRSTFYWTDAHEFVKLVAAPGTESDSSSSSSSSDSSESEADGSGEEQPAAEDSGQEAMLFQDDRGEEQHKDVEANGNGPVSPPPAPYGDPELSVDSAKTARLKRQAKSYRHQINHGHDRPSAIACQESGCGGGHSPQAACPHLTGENGCSLDLAQCSFS